VFDLKPREWAAVIPLVVMMVWMGVYSQSFLPPIGQTTARVLEQTQVNVPFRVKIPEKRLADARVSDQSHGRKGVIFQTHSNSEVARAR
jgi:NADH-quinone oxidoreductase subunit M